MTSNTTYLDEFIQKMYLVPNDINRHLRLIRTLDKKAQSIQQTLNQSQSRFLNQLKEHKQPPNGTLNGSSTSKKQVPPQSGQLPTALKNQYQRIVSKQKQLYGYYREKYEVAQQLKVMVSEFYEQIDGEMKSKMSGKTEDERVVFDNNRRKGPNKYTTGTTTPGITITPATQLSTTGGKMSNGLTNLSSLLQPLPTQFTYDPKEPAYCYCGRGSFGEMVMCENPYCEREWFHLDCIEEKNLPEKWYCNQCQKQKDKTRNNVSRGFFINRDNNQAK